MSLSLYSKILGMAFVVILAAVWGLASWLQPVDGDLARVGGYAENEFGWRAPQAVFEQNLFKVTSDLKDYDKYYDVVVLGDSFSVDQESRRFGWQNYFINRTGLSMIVFDTRRYWPMEIYELPIFKQHPPKVFVFESVERYLHERVAYFSGMTAPAAALSTVPAELFVGAKPLGIKTSEQTASLKAGFDPDHVLGHLGAVVQRHLRLNNQVVEIPLAKKGLFSSPNNTDMLVYFDEFKKQSLSEKDFADLRKGAAVYQKIIEANGFTRFVLLVAPDKSSTFAPYLKNADRATANLVAELAKDPALPVPRTDQILAEAIASGKKDVYLSNDSHWGSIGHKLFADALADHLGALFPPDPIAARNSTEKPLSFLATQRIPIKPQHYEQKSMQEIKPHVGGLAVGILLGIIAFRIVQPNVKSRTPKEMARRWMSWGMLGGMTTGTAHFFRYGGAEGIAGGLLGIFFFSAAGWVLGLLYGLIKFFLFPKIFSKQTALPRVKPADITALREAIGRGDVSAQYQLGMACFAGEGVVKNHIEAYKWILLAQANGHADAKKMSAKMEKTLTSLELAEGQKLATDMHQWNNP